MSRLQPLLAGYLAGIDALDNAIGAMNREQSLARPIDGKWSTLEVVCHLSDMEAVHAGRMKWVIAEDRPALPNADEARFAAALAYDDRDLNEEVAMIRSIRKQMMRILRTQQDRILSREGIHSEAGALTLEQLITRSTEHLNHHLQFIWEKRQALGV